MCGKEQQRVEDFKLKGVCVQNDLKWNNHICNILSKAGQNKNILLKSL